MVFLNKNLCPLLSTALLVSACDSQTVTTVDYVETDTYISNIDTSNHASLNHLLVSKSDSREDRALFKLPTGERKGNTPNEPAFDDLFDALFVGLLFPFYITTEIMQSLLGLCTQEILKPENLTNAKLVFDVVTSQESDLSGKIQLSLLARPWWQNASWDRAHPFSSKGVWSTPGGDLDNSFTPKTSTIGASTNESTIEFDVTDYFKTLLQGDRSLHYGMVLSSALGSLSQTKLTSTQSLSLAARPRVVSTYTGICPQTPTDESSPFSPGSTHTIYLAPNSLVGSHAN